MYSLNFVIVNGSFSPSMKYKSSFWGYSTCGRGTDQRGASPRTGQTTGHRENHAQAAEYVPLLREQQRESLLSG